MRGWWAVPLIVVSLLLAPMAGGLQPEDPASDPEPSPAQDCRSDDLAVPPPVDAAASHLPARDAASPATDRTVETVRDAADRVVPSGCEPSPADMPSAPDPVGPVR